MTTRVTNSYDAWGNKVQRQAWDGSTTTTERYAVDGWDPAKDWAIGIENFDTWADLNGSNAITMRRGYGPGFDELNWRQTSGGTAGWYLTDRLGSVRGVTNSTGTPLTTLTYSGWGAVLSNSTPAQSDAYGFTGRPVDPATGLRNHRERDTPGNQWLQEDPSGLAPDVNNRRYVENSPTNFTDPSGRSIINFTGTDTAGGSVTGPAGNLPTTGGMTGQDVLGMAGLAPPPVHDGIAGLVPKLAINPLTGLMGGQSWLQNQLLGMSLPGMQPAPPPESRPHYPTFEEQYASRQSLLERLRPAGVRISYFMELEIGWRYSLGLQNGLSLAENNLALFQLYSGNLAVQNMSPNERLQEALRRAASQLPGKMGESIREILGNPNTYIVGGVLGVGYIGSHAVGWGFAFDIAILSWIAYKTGKDVGLIEEKLSRATDLARNATTQAQLDEAARLYAESINTILGDGTALAIGGTAALRPAGAVAPGAVGRSEISNSVSNLGRGARGIDEFMPGETYFSGAYNPQTKQLLAYPSSRNTNDLPREAVLRDGSILRGEGSNIVARNGGHEEVNGVLSRLTGHNENNVGFGLFLKADGNLRVEWYSGSMNARFKKSIVPKHLQTEIGRVLTEMFPTKTIEGLR